MKIKFDSLLPILFCCMLLSSCKKDIDDLESVSAVSPSAKVYSGAVACKWNDMTLQLIRSTSGFTPPVASRALGYSNLAAYEAVVPGISDHRSVQSALNLSYTLPDTDVKQRYNWALCSNAAYYQSVRLLFANTSMTNKSRIDSLYLTLKTELGTTEAADVITRSDNYGIAVADQVFEYSKSDNGHEAYSNIFPASYVVPTGPGYWVPTPPAFQAIPMLPYWGNNRSFLPVSQLSNCLPPAPIAFSIDMNSDFYKDALEVYNMRNQLSDEQKAIASFWEDGGGTYTPPGHNINIATQLLREDASNLAFASEVYVRMGLACADAFIACWKAKYAHNILRPVSFIQQNISPGWVPFLTTPPFPEYTSGHSSVSGACSIVLTAMFGNNRTFIDRTNEWLGLPARSFGSFYEAAEEAAMSRLYGGIHYRNGNNRGIQCGKQLGTYVAAISLRR